MKKGLKWVIGIIVVLYLFGRLSGGGSSRTAGTRSAQQTAPAQPVQEIQEQPAAEPVMQEQQETEPVQQVQEPVQQEVAEEQPQQEDHAAEPAAQEQTEQTETQPALQEPADSGIPGVSAEFKNTMDEYEAFFDDYVEFIQMYEESNDIAMMGKYAEMMNQYVVSMQALENMDTEAMTKEEQAYYIEVMSRISQKMLLASQ